MRRPQTGQSLRSFCASWSHQLQKRRFSIAHGSWDFDGAQRQNLSDDLERLARLAVDVGLPRLGLAQDLAAGRGRAKAILLAHRRQSSKGRDRPPAARVRPVRILIFHGYLLGGTGSNVYNARLAAALVRAGHEVHLLCQEREPFEQDWVDAAGDWDGGALRLTTRVASPRARRSTVPISAACCPSTSPTATTASRRARSPTSPTPSSTATWSATSPRSARSPSAPVPTSRSPTTS